MRVIGLTGGIASGKSTVAKLLESLGASVIDADALAREVVAPGESANDAIRAEFGSVVANPDGSINRGVLAGVVFADPEARRRLERIMHPVIAEKAAQKLAELCRLGIPVAFYMAPLLIEAGAVSRVDEIWVVYADRSTQLERLVKRDRMSREEALLRIAAQMPMDEKKACGKVVIDNCGPLEETERQVREIWEREMKSPE